MDAKITTRHQWIDKLEKLIPEIRPLQLHRKKDAVYAVERSGMRSYPDADAYNFSNSADHDVLVQRAVRSLLKRTDENSVGHLLDELTSRKTYGAFSELAAYDWLDNAGITFTPQVKLEPEDVVNPNGSILDGQMELAGQVVYFDVKGFGFIDHKLERLRERLEKNFPGETVATEGVVSVSLQEVQDLLEAGFHQLVTELESLGRAQRGTLRFTRRPKSGVMFSESEHDPRRLAEENRAYAMRDRGQFTRQSPFVLFYIIHPWFSQGMLHQNFGGFVDEFTRSFAELTFKSFEQDTTPCEGIPKSEIMRLLSAVAFINVWPQKSTAEQRPSARVLLNPNARWPILAESFATVKTKLGSAVAIIESDPSAGAKASSMGL